jgi:peptidoglycan/LPS O-acetylase OafA/YrhL
VSTKIAHSIFYVSRDRTNLIADATKSARHCGPGYIPAIDSLRAIAVLAVMVYHIHPTWLRGGFSGVDVFLVVSGYVISRSMLDLNARGLIAFATSFYARRARRILPALLVCLLVASLLMALFIPESWLSDQSSGTASYAVWGLSNYFLVHWGDRYFDPQAEFNPFVHTWSLGVEEQFYWLYPFIFYVWLRSRTAESAKRLLGPTVLALLLLSSFAYSAYATQNDPPAGYYSLSSRFWELACGTQLFQMHTAGWGLGAAPVAQLTVGLITIALGFVFSNQVAFPVPWALSATLGTALVINAVTRPHVSGLLLRVLNSTPLVWIGQRSFSLYLWHWVVYVLFRWTVGLEGWVPAVTALLLIVALSAASYHWIETPFRRKFRRIPPWVVIGCGFGCMAAAWIGLQGINHKRHQISLSVTRDSRSWYPSWENSTGEDTSQGCSPVRTSASFVGGILWLSSRPHCDHSVRTLFVTGDSHALGYATMFTRLVLEQAFDLRLYYKSNCGFLSLKKPTSDAPAECQKFYTAMVEDIRMRAKAGDLLFLPALRLARIGYEWAPNPRRIQLTALHSVKDDSLRRTATVEAKAITHSLIEHGIRIIFEAPKPMFRAPPFRCSDWFNRNNPICEPGFTMPRADLLMYREPVMAQLRELALEPGVSIWDPFNAFCPGAVCEAVSDGKPLFFDGDHPSGAGNERAYGSFVNHLLSLQ